MVQVILFLTTYLWAGYLLLLGPEQFKIKSWENVSYFPESKGLELLQSFPILYLSLC